MVKKRKTKKRKTKKRKTKKSDAEKKQTMASIVKALYPDYLRAPSQRDTPLYFMCKTLEEKEGIPMEEPLEFARCLYFDLVDEDGKWTPKARSIHADASAEANYDFQPLGRDPRSR